MDEIVRLCRPDIYAMKPYSSARTEGKQDASVFLDANENPYPPYPGTDELIGLNRYPEPQPKVLLQRFAEFYNAPQENLFVSRGADEAIDLLVRAFCAAGKDGILITPPTFVMYETAAEIQGASVTRVPLTADVFQLDVDAMLHAHTEHTKLVFVCSPNNPTGNLLRRDDIVRLADELFGKALIVVDHTYIDYSHTPSLASEIKQRPNIVVLRTLSKEYSLTGERCGITIAHPEVIGILRRIMAPYPIPVSVTRHVMEAMSQNGISYAKNNMQRLLSERDRVAAVLQASPTTRRLFPSSANFLLMQTADAKLLVQMMEENGIKIRDRSNVLEQAVRISIGQPDENDRMLEVFAAYAEKES